MHRKKTFYIIYAVLTGILSLLFIAEHLLLPSWYSFRSKQQIGGHLYPLLDSLAKKALTTNDVPVAAVLVYGSTVIGEGFNTVYKQNDICGHAELNALNNAVQSLGMDSFKGLDRQQLSMISTFEPCMMCKGALVENDIYRATFVLAKSAKDRYRSFRKEWKYKIHLRESNDPYFQYALFRLHPDFDSTAYPFSY